MGKVRLEESEVLLILDDATLDDYPLVDIRCGEEVVRAPLEIEWEVSVFPEENAVQLRIIDRLMALLAEAKADLIAGHQASPQLIETASGWSTKANVSYS